MMNEIILNVNAHSFECAYEKVSCNNSKNLNINMFDFLFDCNPLAAYDFMRYCLKRNQNKIFRLALCNLIAYGDLVVENANFIDYQQVSAILNDDPNFYPIMEFVIYNYYEQPESPFSDLEFLSFANKVLSDHKDKVELKIVK